MAISRYNNTEEQQLDDLDYKKVYSDKFNNNRKKFLLKKATLNLQYPDFDEVLQFDYDVHVWKLGDHYYKLAERFYGNPSYWWVIAWFNKKPTESHVKIGDLIRIPLPIGEVLTSLGF
jgi:hypothetical protein